MARQWQIWRVFWFVAVPGALIYQLLWAVIFQQLADSGWEFKQYQILILGKLCSEILLYVGLGLLMLYRTKHPRQWPKYVCSSLFFLLAVVTVPPLIENLVTL